MDVEIFVQNVKKYSHAMNEVPTISCRKAGVGASFISDIKRGRTPSVGKFQMLADYFGITTSELLGEKENPVLQTEDGVDETISRLLGVLGNLTPEERKQVTAFAEGIQAGRKTPASEHT